jgi:hypothetical protein
MFVYAMNLWRKKKERKEEEEEEEEETESWSLVGKL